MAPDMSQQFCLYIISLSALQVMNLSASTGSLVAITIERYRAICLPFTPPLSKFQAKLTIAVVSMTAFLLALPEVGAYNLGPPFGCMEKFPTVELRKAYSLLLFLACYLLPLLFIVPAYTRMILRLWRDREDFPGSGVSEDPKNRKRKRNVLKMMAIVVICYAVCMLPTYAMFLWLDFGLKSTGKQYSVHEIYRYPCLRVGTGIYIFSGLRGILGKRHVFRKLQHLSSKRFHSNPESPQ